MVNKVRPGTTLCLKQPLKPYLLGRALSIQSLLGTTMGTFGLVLGRCRRMPQFGSFGRRLAHPGPFLKNLGLLLLVHRQRLISLITINSAGGRRSSGVRK